MSESITGNQLRGHLETMVLSVLSQGEAHGFEILKRLGRRGEGAFSLKEGTVYPVLYRLEQGGLVTAHWEGDESKHRGPRRRIYRLTRKGERCLDAARQQWSEFVNVVGGIILQGG